MQLLLVCRGKRRGGNEGVSGCGWVFRTSVLVWPKLAPKGSIYLCVRHVHAYAPPRTPLTHLIAKAKITWNGGLNGSSQRAKQRSGRLAPDLLVIDGAESFLRLLEQSPVWLWKAWKKEPRMIAGRNGRRRRTTGEGTSDQRPRHRYSHSSPSHR